MPSYVTPKKGVEFIFYISLVSQANTKIMQSNPTIAAGDFKVSIDGGALANPAILPAVTPASSKMVKVTLSTSEMNGDNITFVASDASGAEWADLVVNIQTSARQIDDLAYPTTSGRSLDVTATGAAGIDWANVENPTTTLGLTGTTAGLIDNAITAAKIATGAIDADAIAANAITDAAVASDVTIASVTGAVGSVAAGVTVTTNNDKTGYSLSAAGIQAFWDALTSALTTVGSIGKLLVDNLNAAITSRSSHTAANVRTEMDSNSTQLAAIVADTAEIGAAGAGLTALGDTRLANLDAAISTRSTVTTAQVNAEVLDVMTVDTFAEASAVPAATSTLKDKINWLFLLARNKITQTATTQLVRNDADSATIGTSTVSDDGTTAIRGEFS